jgi:hypothetical protein
VQQAVVCHAAQSGPDCAQTAALPQCFMDIERLVSVMPVSVMHRLLCGWGVCVVECVLAASV